MAMGSYTRMIQPAFNSLSIITRAVDSRISSVSGLNESPHMAMVLPFRASSEPKAFTSFSKSTLFCFSFTRSTAFSTSIE